MIYSLIQKNLYKCKSKKHISIWTTVGLTMEIWNGKMLYFETITPFKAPRGWCSNCFHFYLLWSYSTIRGRGQWYMLLSMQYSKVTKQRKDGFTNIGLQIVTFLLGKDRDMGELSWSQVVCTKQWFKELSNATQDFFFLSWKLHILLMYNMTPFIISFKHLMKSFSLHFMHILKL